MNIVGHNNHYDNILLHMPDMSGATSRSVKLVSILKRVISSANSPAGPRSGPKIRFGK